MEQVTELVHTNSSWFLIIGSVIAVFLLISMLRALFKLAVLLIVVSVTLVFLFNVAPGDLAETGADALTSGSEILHERIIPLLSDLYLETFYNNETDANDE